MTVGIVGTAIFAFLPDKIGSNWQMTLLWGIICGIFSAVGNILLIESMTNLSAGICSTIYRLNLALVVPMSMVFFHEKLTWTQWCGTGLAIAAVLAFLPAGRNSSGDKKKVLLPMVMIITASIFRAGLGLGCKYGPMEGASLNGINFMIEIIWIISGLVYYLLKERRSCVWDSKVLKYGAGSGVLVAGILFFMILALSVGKASVVLPIAQMSFLATFILSVIFLKEKITVLKIFALFCGVGAMLLLT
jgi:drug/metabolite transporter (DMT)-like permease